MLRTNAFKSQCLLYLTLCVCAALFLPMSVSVQAATDLPTVATPAQQAAAAAAVGSSLWDQKRWPEVETAFREAVRLQPANGAYSWNLGVSLYQQKKWPEAEQFFREAVRLQPENARYQDWLGITLNRQKKHGEAETHHREAVRLSPSNAAYQNNLGNDFYNQGFWPDAQNSYREAVRLEPSNKEYQQNLRDATDKFILQPTGDLKVGQKAPRSQIGIVNCIIFVDNAMLPWFQDSVLYQTEYLQDMFALTGIRFVVYSPDNLDNRRLYLKFIGSSIKVPQERVSDQGWAFGTPSIFVTDAQGYLTYVQIGWGDNDTNTPWVANSMAKYLSTILSPDKKKLIKGMTEKDDATFAKQCDAIRDDVSQR